MTWRDLNLKKYLEIVKIIEDSALSEPEKQLYLVETIFDVDTEYLPTVQYLQLVNELSFLETEISHEKVKKKIEIDGVNYLFCDDVSQITVAQFQDITTYQKNNDIRGLISTILIPEGHKYNDDYEMDFLDKLNMVQVTSMLFFYKNVYEIFTNLFQTYIEKTMKKIQKNKKLKEEEKKQILESYQSLSDTLKKLTQK